MHPQPVLRRDVVSWLVFCFGSLTVLSAVHSQSKYANRILFQDSVTVTVTNIAIDSEFSFRGLTADFPYPVISTISIIDNRGNPILGLADTLSWLDPDDVTQIGLPVSAVWSRLLEYHLEDPQLPADPDLYNQLPRPRFTEVRESTRLPTTTILVMDASGSMEEEIADAKAGAILYVDQLRPTDQAGVVVFGTTVKDFQPLTDQTELLRAAINRASAEGFTALYDAILVAVNDIKGKGGRQGIIVYTDGKDNRSVNATPRSVIDSCRVHNIPVFTIALGDSTNETNLIRVAEQTGGLFFKVASAEEMAVIYLKLSELIQNYYLMAHSSPDPVRNDTWRVVDITMNAANFTGQGVGQYFVAAPPPPPPTDLEVTMQSITDSAIVAGDSMLNAVFPGDQYQYEIRIINRGPSKSDTVRLIQFLPDSVRFVDSNLAPASIENNLLSWEFTDFEAGAENNIQVSVAFAANIPPDLVKLPSLASVTAANDTLLSNNAARDTVLVLTAPVRIPHYDLEISQTVLTDTTAIVAGESVPATRPGRIFDYSIAVKNLGPGLASDFTVFDVIPDSVVFGGFNIEPSLQTGNTVFWQLDSLSAGDAITLAFQARVSDSLMTFPFEVLNISEVYAERDTNSANDSTTTITFVIPNDNIALPNEADLSVTQVAVTDSFTVENGDTLRFVRNGEDYDLAIRVVNESLIFAQNVRVVSVLPDSASVSDYEPVAAKVTADSVAWTFPLIEPGGSRLLQLSALLAQSMPLGLNALIHHTTVSAKNENPALLGNNAATDTLFNFSRPGGDIGPLIEALPAIIDVGDSVQVRVQIRVESNGWDLWVKFEDSSIDSTYGDTFIRNRPITLNEWMTLSPRFGGTRLTTDSEQEEIIFEVRNTDVLGTLRTARAAVVIQSSNAMVLERNIFAASREDLLGINFKLSSNRSVRLDLYDVAGSLITTIADAPFSAGWNTYNWDGTTRSGQKIGSGLYIITLRSGGYSAMKKVMVVR